jgi:predicted nucleic acid-binding protein
MSKSLLVADSWPLIALAKLQRLDLAGRLFRQVLVPEAVLRECLSQAHLPDAMSIRDALTSGELNEVQDAVPSDRLRQYGLDAGETAALAVAEALRAEVLVDERLGRRAARMLGLPVIGVCGLLLLGKRAGYVGAIRPLLDKLCHDCGYYLARDLRNAMLAAAGEEGG